MNYWRILNLVSYITYNFDNINRNQILDIIFIIDWKHTLTYWKPYLDWNKWYNDTYWPTSLNLSKIVNEIIENKEYIRTYNDKLENIFDFINTRKEKTMEWEEILLRYILLNDLERRRLIISLYPIWVSPKYTFLDLESLAKRYKEDN